MSLFSIRSAGGSEFELLPAIPDDAGMLKIPFAHPHYAYGNAGKFSFQQIPFPGGSWWYSVYQPAHRVELSGSSNQEVLELYSAVRNHFVSEWDGIGTPNEKENQMGFGFVPWVNNKAILEAGVVYETMDLHPELDWVIEVCKGVPGKVDGFLNSLHGRKKALRIEGAYQVSPSMGSIMRRICRPDCPSLKLERSLLLQSELFVLEALNQFEPPPLFSQPGDHNKAEQIEHILRKRMDDPPLITELARLVMSNAQTIQKIFKARFGETIDDYSRRLRLELAQQFLLDSDKNLHVIASETGYNDASALSRAFKKLYHCSPGEFRKTGGNLKNK